MKKFNLKDAENTLKSTFQKLIRNISIIAIFIALSVIALSYLGVDYASDWRIVAQTSISSVILLLSNIVIYELWSKSGANNAREEKSYMDLLKEYDKNSDGIHYDTMQEFLDYEYKRRYDVEYDRLTRMIDRDTQLRDKLSRRKEIDQLRADMKLLVLEGKKNCPKYVELELKLMEVLKIPTLDRIRVKFLVKSIKRNTIARDGIKITLPYIKSEELDYLRYNIKDVFYKEFKPTDTKKYINKHRSKKYAELTLFTMIGINVLSFSLMFENWDTALFMTLVAGCSILFSLVIGFQHGYNSVAVISTGVYKTANQFIEKANAYCIKEKKYLYYKDMPEGWLDKIKREAQEKEKVVQQVLALPEIEQPTITLKSGEEEIVQTKLEVD